MTSVNGNQRSGSSPSTPGSGSAAVGTTPAKGVDGGKLATDLTAGLLFGGLPGAVLTSIGGHFGLGIGDLFSEPNTTDARNHGREEMSTDGDWSVPQAWFDAIETSYARPDEHAKAKQRLTEIDSFMKLVGRYMKANPELAELMLATALPITSDMEDGTMGDVIALIMSGDTSKLKNLMGYDGGFFGNGDGLDDGEWSTIKDKFMKSIGEFKQTFDLKLPTHADEIFDAHQEEVAAYWRARLGGAPEKA